MIVLVIVFTNCLMLCLCCFPPLGDILHTLMARYSLFVLKVPLNNRQTNKGSDMPPEVGPLLAHGSNFGRIVVGRHATKLTAAPSFRRQVIVVFVCVPASLPRVCSLPGERLAAYGC